MFLSKEYSSQYLIGSVQNHFELGQLKYRLKYRFSNKLSDNVQKSHR